MAESTQVALAVASIPSSADIARAEEFVRERFLHDGEDPAVALARVGGSANARRRALDAALAELQEQARYPSTAWRREYSLLLGLERLLSDQEPKLRDGTVLSAHQVDALSGTLTALLAEAERANGATNGRAAAAASPELLASAAILRNGRPAAAPAAEDAVSTQTDAEPAAEEDEQERRLEAEEADVLVEDEEEQEQEGDDEEEELGDLEDELEPLPEVEDEEEELQEESDEEPRDWVEEDEEEQLSDQPEDPNAAKRFWFEHATGAGKTVAALGFVEASQTGGILILTHRRNLVDQFLGELRQRGYSRRISRPLYKGEDSTQGPVSVETYQWFVRNAGRISSAYTIVICDEAHTALGEKTSGAIRAWTGPIFIGMTATGALIARHVTDLFPTQTSRFDLAQAARRGVIAPLRCVRIPPGVGVRTIAKVPLRRGEVDVEFDQEELAQLLDQQPFNLAMANLYRTRFNGVPGVVYAAGVRHAYNLAEAFRAEEIKAQAVSGETPKRELASILARYERGDIDVLINAQLLAEGWNSPRATVCVHLAPTASKRIYQQRVGRVTRRNPGKEAGLVVDFVHPATKHDDPVVTLHSLLDRDVYRGGAIVVGPVRRGRGRRIRVERRVLPVCAEEDRRIQVLERELWRIAVENLEYGEQHGWAALAGARVTAPGWRRARAMLHFDRTGELKSSFLISAVKRNPNPQLRLRALADIAAGRDPDAFDTAIDEVGTWGREERREGSKIMLRALVERRIGRRDQAAAWIWRLAEYTRELHEEYAVQRWPETKRLLGLLVNSSGGAHARNARRLIHASRKQDRRLAAALLAAALAHTPEAEEALRGARTRMARKPPALARELLRNFPKRRARNNKRKRRTPRGGAAGAERTVPAPVVEGVPIPVDSEAASIAQAVSVAEGAVEATGVTELADSQAPVSHGGESGEDHAVTETQGSAGDADAKPSRRKAKQRAKKPAKSAEEAVEAAAARVIAASSAPVVEDAQGKKGKEQDEGKRGPKKRPSRAKAATGKTAAAKAPGKGAAGKAAAAKPASAKARVGTAASGRAGAGKAAGAKAGVGTAASGKAGAGKAVGAKAVAGKTTATKAKPKAAKPKIAAAETPDS